LKFLTKILFILISVNSLAQVVGNSIYSFINVPVPARTAALGGNTIGLKDDDVSLILQNPSSINSSMSNKFQMSYINYIADINFFNLQYCKSFDSIGHFGVSLQNVNYGKFVERDEYGTEKGTFTANDYQLNLTYGNEIDSMFSWGVNVKTIYSQLYTFSSIGNALDAGLTWKNKRRNFAIALVMNDLGIQWKSYSGTNKEKITPYFNIGISKKLAKAPLRFLINYERINKWDLSYNDPNNPAPTLDPFTKEEIKTSKFKTFNDKLFRHISLGAEISPGKNFNLRIGYNFRRHKEMRLPDGGGMSGFSFGFGIKISKLVFNYAFSKYHASGNVNHLSLLINIK
jgi:hypothetical protein